MHRLGTPKSDEEYLGLLERGVFEFAPDAPSHIRRRDPSEKASIKFAENAAILTDAILDRAGLYKEQAGSHELTPEGADLFPTVFYSSAKYICDNHFKKQKIDLDIAENYLLAAWKFRDELKALDKSHHQGLRTAAENHNKYKV